MMCICAENALQLRHIQQSLLNQSIDDAYSSCSFILFYTGQWIGFYSNIQDEFYTLNRQHQHVWTQYRPSEPSDPQGHPENHYNNLIYWFNKIFSGLISCLQKQT